MKIIADRITLLTAAKTAAQSAAVSNSPMPELAGLLLEADTDNHMLRLTGTNTETCVQIRLKDVRIEQGGSVVIDAVLLCEMLRLLRDETVSIETDSFHQVRLESGAASYSVMVLSAENFPKPDIPFPEDTVQITGLPKLIRQTVFAAGDNPEQPALHGVRLAFSKSNTNLAATDARRLAVAASDTCADGDLEAVLHQRSLRVLNNVVDAGDKLFAGIAGKTLVLFNENVLFCARLYERPFTDVERMLSAVDKAYGCVCDAKELLKALEMMDTAAKYLYDSHIHFVIVSNGIQLRTECEIRSGFRVAAKNITPTPVEGFYYYPYLMLDFLRLAKGDVEIAVSKQGLMLLNAGGYQYLLTSRHKPKPKPEEQPETGSKAEKPENKAPKNKKTADKAA